MTTDEKIILTADEAISLLAEGPYVHNFVSGPFMMIGCDYDRDGAIKAFNDAKLIEIGGPACKQMKHPLAVWDQDGRVSFFEADMDKVAAMETAKTPVPA